MSSEASSNSTKNSKERCVGMNRERIKELIDKEQGYKFSENISLSGYTFYKNNSFINFKISRLEDGISVANIKYIYSDSKEDLISIIAFACNFWLGTNVKFIYYKEKKKAPYVINTMRRLGFKIVNDRISVDWPVEFVCKKCKSTNCRCITIEAYS